MSFRIFLLLLLVVVTSCGNDDAPAEGAALVVAEGCQPLLAGVNTEESGQAACLLPYPSDFHRSADPTTATGFRVTLRGEAKPRRSSGAVVDVHDAYAHDGASIVTPIVATLPSALVTEGLPSVNSDPAASTRPDSATVLLDVERNALVPHYTDLHPNVDEPRRSPLVLRPFVPLRHRARYVVALVSVRDDAGIAPPPEGFRRLRDGVSDPAIAPLADRFAREIFAPLAAVGVAREKLQLAWDFTTGSSEQSETAMLRVKELARAWIATNPPVLMVTGDETSGDFRRVTATITGPQFLTDDGTRALLFRDGSGAVAQNGTTTFPVTIRIPVALAAGAAPGRLVAYGHGFFGSRGELDGSSAGRIASRLGAVIFGIDWRGFSSPDRIVVSDTLVEDPVHATDLTERVHQAIVNWMVTVAAMRSATTFVRADGGPLFDPGFVGYFGASLGHILGGVLAGVDDTFGRVVLNVGGGGFTQMMPRASPFATFALLLRSVFSEPLMVQAYIAALQRAFDRIDPITWAPHVGPKVLIQTGIGDDQVPNVTSFLHAAALGARQVVPAPRRIFGLEETPGGQAGSAITLFDYGIDTSSPDPEPPNPNKVHEAVRIEESALRQMDAFLRPDGVAIQPCEGPCDPG